MLAGSFFALCFVAIIRDLSLRWLFSFFVFRRYLVLALRWHSLYVASI